ncbi:MAG: hypothetical protein KME19_00645 [Microcoleus vaginatus WJT46-NPBG5]|nr:hypothetical protein [Microcoleus vaginatus WJT46-NPBG5]
MTDPNVAGVEVFNKKEPFPPPFVLKENLNAASAGAHTEPIARTAAPAVANVNLVNNCDAILKFFLLMVKEENTGNTCPIFSRLCSVTLAALTRGYFLSGMPADSANCYFEIERATALISSFTFWRSAAIWCLV